MASHLLFAFSKVVVPLFFLGMAGSALVVIATIMHDLGEVTSSDHHDTADL